MGAGVWLVVTGAAHVPVVWLESSERKRNARSSIRPGNSHPMRSSSWSRGCPLTSIRAGLHVRSHRAGATAGACRRSGRPRRNHAGLKASAPVFIVARNGSEAPAEDATALAGLALEPKRTLTLLSTGLFPALGAWPDTIEHVVYPVSVYQARNIATLPWHVDIGGQDYGTLGAGWRDREALLGASGRWTAGGGAEIAIPALSVPLDRP